METGEFRRTGGLENFEIVYFLGAELFYKMFGGFIS